MASPNRLLLNTLHWLSLSRGPASTGHSTELITEDAYFYGQSPPVYPSPKMDGRGYWSDAHRQAVKFVSQLTLEEKVSLTAGYPSGTGCSGFLNPIDRLNFPGICVSDAGNGLRGTELVSSWPGGIHVGASWNRELAYDRGEGMGGEYQKKGVNMMLGPVVGPIGRVVQGGRVWEGFGTDPYLSGQLTYETVLGVQSTGVGTSTKHFIGNEQEDNRNPEGDIASVSSNIDDKTMHELYLWPFVDAVRAGTTNIMCSYQRLNNSYGCQNSKTLNGLLKTELAFQGYVMSDWGAIHGGVAAAEAGLDTAFPDDGGYWGENLVQAVQNGSLPQARVDDMVTRMMAAYYYLDQQKHFEKPGIGMPGDLTAPHVAIDARDKRFKKTLYEGAVEGHVLLKNEGHALPLKKPKILSIFGFSARATDQNSLSDGWLGGWAPYESQGPHPGRSVAINGTLITAGGSGASSLGIMSSPMDAITAQAWEDDTDLFWDFTTDSPRLSGASDACLVMINQFSTEGFDRPGLASDYADRLVNNVADKCNNTIVVMHNVAVALVEEWINHPNVRAVVFAHLPGQYSGKALVDLLYGRENFSGRLPFTVAKKAEDYGETLRPSRGEGVYERFPQSDFTEGVLIDYKRFDSLDIEPRYHFGYGLSYTSFEYSHLKVALAHHHEGHHGHHAQRSQVDDASAILAWSEYPSGPVLPGGHETLFEVLVEASARVKNVGHKDGKEVAQLYLSIPGSGQDGNPVKQLRGFHKQHISAGDEETFKFLLTRRDLSTWDVVAQKWKLQKGTYKIMVGRNSGDLPLEHEFDI
ncbi:beta-glucosidase [Kockovaella imperatae]|uniref:beta-glucosidase n=1 Tax=Kockovaella imperatae TaxID=4999 RepID=A0A1Y1UJX3_9TREE|nr:beta-glucosidase [Kockovaella imperatae]ORX38353.1 beta-glucosidase [Kockovaella imperatae]